jgi:Fur family ferric uptake transcriptional regulator
MQKLEQIFTDEMRRANLRITQNRRAIFRILAGSRAPLSIREILARGNRKNHFTSVYRSIETMTRAGILREIPRGFKNLYELGENFQPHHHHATCEKCGKTVVIHDENLEKLMQNLTLRADLTPTIHQFELFGICEKCQ